MAELDPTAMAVKILQRMKCPPKCFASIFGLVGFELGDYLCDCFIDFIIAVVSG